MNTSMIRRRRVTHAATIITAKTFLALATPDAIAGWVETKSQSGARKTVCPERLSRPLLSLPTCGVLERFAPKIVKGKRTQGSMKTHGPTVTTIAVCFTFLSPLIGILVAFLAAWLLGVR